MLRILLGVLLFLPGLFTQAETSPKDTFVIAATQGNPINEPGYMIVSRAYARLGINTELREFPARRALVMANSGQVDAELGRNPIIEAQTPNLIRIPVLTLSLNMVAITLQQEARFADFKDLQPLRVGYVRGAVRVKNKLRAEEMIDVSRPVQLFSLLRSGRADAIVLNEMVAGHLIGQQENPQLFYSHVIDTEMPFHYVHKRHAHLVSSLTQEFKTMHASGEMKKILDEFIQRRWPDSKKGFGTKLVK